MPLSPPPLRFAFAGFRHGHIFDLHSRATAHPDMEITGAAEDEAAARTVAAEQHEVLFTHDSTEALIAEGNFDILAVGDYFAKRGSLAVAALQRGKHVISDKPICTSLAELDEIESLTARHGLKLGCMLDLRDQGPILAMRQVILDGFIGEVQTVQVEARHPLLRATRPAWYFEEGKQGGTINDIGIHAFDLVPWMTGQTITGIVGARVWNGKAADAPCFKDCGQFLLELGNGGGVTGDVSYLAPDGIGFKAPQYWRLVVHGTKGLLEGAPSSKTLLLATDGNPQPQSVAIQENRPGQYLEDFLADLAGTVNPESLHTEDVIKASRVALRVQAVADTTRQTTTEGRPFSITGSAAGI